MLYITELIIRMGILRFIYSVCVQTLGLLPSPLPHRIFIHRHLRSTSTVQLHRILSDHFPRTVHCHEFAAICCSVLWWRMKKSKNWKGPQSKSFSTLFGVLLYLQNSHWVSLRKWKSEKGTIANIKKSGQSHTSGRPSYSRCFGQLSFVDDAAMQKKREGTASSSFQVPTSLKHH